MSPEVSLLPSVSVISLGAATGWSSRHRRFVSGIPNEFCCEIHLDELASLSMSQGGPYGDEH